MDGAAALLNLLVAGAIVGGGAMVAWDQWRGNDTLKRFTWTLKFIDKIGHFLRSHILSPDREGVAMSRADRETIQAMARDGEEIISFGSNVNPHFAGTMRFANAQYFQPTGIDPMTIGDPAECKPFTATHIFNGSAASFGALSEPTTMAFSRGAAKSGAFLNIGEGGFYRKAHTEGNKVGQCNLVFQIGTDKNSVRGDVGYLLDDDKLRALVRDNPEFVMIEIKLVQGAIPGEGGHLKAAKMTPLIAQIRGRKAGEDCEALDHQVEITDDESLARFIGRVRKASGLPTGFKTSYSRRAHIESQFATFKRLGIYPDFITLDGGEGGTGKGPGVLVNHMGALLSMSLPMLVDVRAKYGLQNRIRILSSGRLFTPNKGAIAIAMGSDFVVSTRGVMTAGGCVGQNECHLGTCKKGLTTQDPALTNGYNIEAEGDNIARYFTAYNNALIKVAHGCGKADVRDLSADDVDIMQDNGILTKTMREFFADLKLK